MTKNDKKRTARPIKFKGEPVPGHKDRFTKLLGHAAKGEKEAGKTSTPERGER